MRIFLPLLLSSCTLFAAQDVCLDPAGDLAPGLKCTEADPAVDYVALLSGRRVDPTHRGNLLREIGARFASDPADARADIESMKSIIAEITSVAGMTSAERRSTRAWEALDGEGPLDFVAYPNAQTVLESRIAIWGRDSEEKLVLTETDIEGWIKYASLCREAQGAGPLSLSIANRELLYREVKRKFQDADRDEQIALASMGSVWHQIEQRWIAATYAGQQAWIAAAPLPPPMTGTSMAYAATIIESDLAEHAKVLHRTLGPFKPKVP